MRALVVDDEPGCSTVIQKMLAPHADADIAEDVSDAIACFESAHESGEPYHLICLDLCLPSGSGHDVLDWIRHREDEFAIPQEQRAKVFITSSQYDPENVSKAYRSLCHEFLEKPFERRELLELLQTHNLM